MVETAKHFCNKSSFYIKYHNWLNALLPFDQSSKYELHFIAREMISRGESRFQNSIQNILTSFTKTDFNIGLFINPAIFQVL